MGDLLRKYMALETYIPHYQAIRGDLVMRETLATFRPDESRSFLLILNAIEELARERSAFARPDQPQTAPCDSERLHAEWMARADAFVPSANDTGRLETELLEGFKIRFAHVLSEFERHRTNAKPDLAQMGSRLITDITQSLARKTGQRPAEILLELELACLILDGWSQVAAADRLLS
jgi:hypothetical protein